MAHQTLEELKADNALEDEVEVETTQVEDEAETEDVVEVDTEEQDDAGELKLVETEETDTEGWMQGDTDDDDDGSQPSSVKFNDSDMAKTRRKYKAKLADKDDELERLRADNEALRSGKGKQGQLTKPERDNYDDDEAFQDALMDYKIEVRDTNRQASDATSNKRTEQNRVKQETAQAVDKHYERAVTLSEKAGISAEMYQNSDFRVRSMVDGLFKGAGDAIVDALISNLGAGSEKVMYSIGVKNSRLAELKDLFEQDPTGVKASMYLGQLKSELTAPQKRKTQAPKPAPVIAGDAVKDEKSRKLKKAYGKADKAGNLQDRFNARREARKAGVDTSNW